jgi:hypothetical protein
MKYLAWATLAILAFAGTQSAQEPSASADEIQIRQLERAWNQAEAKQEVGAISALLAEGFVYTDYDGSFMAHHLYDEGITVHVYDKAAVATGIYRETGSNKGKPYVIRSRFTDTWINRKGVWLCVASHSTLLPAK